MSCVWREGEKRSSTSFPPRILMKPFYLDFSLFARPSLSLYFPPCPRKFYIISSLLFRAIQFSPGSSYKLNSRPGFKKRKPSGEPFLKNNHKVLRSVMVLNNDILPLQISSNMCPNDGHQL